MRALILSLTAMFFAALPANARACQFVPPDQRIAQFYEAKAENGGIVAVALVEVIDGNYTRLPANNGPTFWEAEARPVRQLYGKQALPETVTIGRDWFPHECSDAFVPLPDPGDRMVAYFWMNRASQMQVTLVLTLEEARRNDPRHFPKPAPSS